MWSAKRQSASLVSSGGGRGIAIEAARTLSTGVALQTEVLAPPSRIGGHGREHQARTAPLA